VFKFAGDAILVIWPPSDEDLITTCRRAAQCALEIKNKLQDADVGNGIHLNVKVGVGVGAISILHIGGVFGRLEYIATGQPLLQAFGAEHCAVQREVVVSPEVWSMVKEYFKADINDTGHAFLQDCPKPVKKFGIAAANQKDKLFSRLGAQAMNNIGKYVPSAVLPFVNHHEERWASELRRISVLFVNLGVAEEELATLNTDEDVLKIHRVLESVQLAVYQYEGSLNKFLMDDKGSTLIAVFGLPPLAHEDDSLRGTLAAIAICNRLHSLGLRAAVGVTTGMAFCGVVGARGRREYSALGDTVNLAARLMQHATKNQCGVICDTSTAYACRHRLLFEDKGSIKVKGKAKPLTIWAPVDTNIAPAIIRGKTHFPYEARKYDHNYVAHLNTENSSNSNDSSNSSSAPSAALTSPTAAAKPVKMSVFQALNKKLSGAGKSNLSNNSNSKENRQLPLSPPIILPTHIKRESAIFGKGFSKPTERLSIFTNADNLIKHPTENNNPYSSYSHNNLSPSAAAPSLLPKAKISVLFHLQTSANIMAMAKARSERHKAGNDSPPAPPPKPTKHFSIRKNSPQFSSTKDDSNNIPPINQDFLANHDTTAGRATIVNDSSADSFRHRSTPPPPLPSHLNRSGSGSNATNFPATRTSINSFGPPPSPHIIDSLNRHTNHLRRASSEFSPYQATVTPPREVPNSLGIKTIRVVLPEKLGHVTISATTLHNLEQVKAETLYLCNKRNLIPDDEIQPNNVWFTLEDSDIRLPDSIDFIHIDSYTDSQLKLHEKNNLNLQLSGHKSIKKTSGMLTLKLFRQQDELKLRDTMKKSRETIINKLLKLEVDYSSKFTILIEGDIGMGKSRLLFNSILECDRNKIQFLAAAGSAFSTGPYAVLVDLLLQLIDDGVDVATTSGSANPDALLNEYRRKCMASKLNNSRRSLTGENYASLLWCLNSVMAGLNFPLNDSSNNLTNQQQLDIAQELLELLFQSFSLTQPLVLIIDDAIYCEESSWNVLLNLTTHSKCSISLLIATRPMNKSYLPAFYKEVSASYLKLSAHSCTTLISLKARSEEVILAIAKENFGVEVTEIPNNLAYLILHKVGGNPLSTQELVYNLKKEKLVEVEGSKVILSKSFSDYLAVNPLGQAVISHNSINLDSKDNAKESASKSSSNNLQASIESMKQSVHVPVSITVQFILGCRLDRLSHIQRMLLKCGAIIGDEFHYWLAEKIYPLVKESEDQMKQELQNLCDLNIIKEKDHGLTAAAVVNNPDLIQAFAEQSSSSFPGTLFNRRTKFQFTHGFLRELVLSRMLDYQKKELQSEMDKAKQEAAAANNIPIAAMQGRRASITVTSVSAVSPANIESNTHNFPLPSAALALAQGTSLISPALAAATAMNPVNNNSTGYISSISVLNQSTARPSGIYSSPSPSPALTSPHTPNHYPISAVQVNNPVGRSYPSSVMVSPNNNSATINSGAFNSVGGANGPFVTKASISSKAPPQIPSHFQHLLQTNTTPNTSSNSAAAPLPPPLPVNFKPN
jgi:class 3 adenylate cyclase